MSESGYLEERRRFLKRAIGTAGLTLVAPAVLSVVTSRELSAQVSAGGAGGRPTRRSGGPSKGGGRPSRRGGGPSRRN